MTVWKHIFIISIGLLLCRSCRLCGLMQAIYTLFQWFYLRGSKSGWLQCDGHSLWWHCRHRAIKASGAWNMSQTGCGWQMLAALLAFAYQAHHRCPSPLWVCFEHLWTIFKPSCQKVKEVVGGWGQSNEFRTTASWLWHESVSQHSDPEVEMLRSPSRLESRETLQASLLLITEWYDMVTYSQIISRCM